MIISLTFAVLVGPPGCLRYTQPVAPPQQLTAHERRFEALWESARQVLRRYYFELDRQDRRAGVITTQPLVGRHFFELWRADATTPKDVLEGTLQSLVRQATVSIYCDDRPSGRYNASVEVLLWRSNKQTFQVTSTSEAYGLAGAGGGTARRRLLVDSSRSAPGDHLVSLGRDEKLQAKLTEEILATAALMLTGPSEGSVARRFRQIFGQELPTPRDQPYVPPNEQPAQR